MSLDLILPGLFWQNTNDLEYIYHHAGIANFNHLIRRAKIELVDFCYSDFLYHNLIGSHATQPTIARQIATEAGLTNTHTYFLVVEPTHLTIDRDRLLISEPELLQLNENEQRIIISSLNQHFTNEYSFYYIADNLWLAGFDNQPPKSNLFYPICDIVGENIDQFLPTRSDEIWYSKLINEAQMILHHHPINLERKNNKALTVNSIWVWDKKFNNNQLDRFFPKNIMLYTNNLQLLKKGGTLINPLSNNFRNNSQNNAIIFIDSLYYPNKYQDRYSYLELINWLNNQLTNILNHKNLTKIQSLNLYIPRTRDTLKILINKFDKFKLWRNNTFTKITKDYNEIES